MRVFGSLLTTPIDRLNIGARAHAILAAEGQQGYAECLARDDWHCRNCGVHLPDYMEVEHVASHDDHTVGNLICLCQFCHNLRHPLWAASRGRLRPFWSSGTDQRSIHALAWSVLITTLMPEGFAEAHRAIMHLLQAIRHREQQLRSLLGSTHPEAMFESLLYTNQQHGTDHSQAVASQLDTHIRFWPSAADYGGTREAAALSVWDGDRFHDRSRQFGEDMSRSGHDLSRLRLACASAAGLHGAIPHQG
ncbi:MAG: HNH endonuclease [Rhodobacteraceae bacterium]|nr:HNH endonuclease [Paracoccaceae bacterium]